MLEANIRKIHRTVGLYLVGFLVLQAFTGLLIALGTLLGISRETLWLTIMIHIHHDWNPVGSAYRILLGGLAIGQGLGGLAIYLLMRSRLNES